MRPAARKRSVRELIESTPQTARDNIRTIVELEQQALGARSVAERTGDAVAHWAGRGSAVVFHAVWFALWVLINTGKVPGIPPFDPYPFSFLTLVVSLEAIFLSLFIMMSQSRLGRQADQRAQLDLQVNLLAEYEATKTLQLLQSIAKKLGLEEAEDEEVRHLALKTDPAELMRELQRELPADA